MTRASVALGVILAALAACGDEPSSHRPGDAGASEDAAAHDSGLSFPVAPPAPPLSAAPPAQPVLTPCPDGWRTTTSTAPDAVAVCDPWPEGGQEICAPHEAHLVGAPGCTRIGPPCPVDWPSDLPETGVIYVRSSSTSTGSGTQGDPYGSIAAALRGARGHEIIVLARGVYREQVVLDRDLTLRGSCVEHTVLNVDLTNPDENGALAVAGGNVKIRDLQITSEGYGIWIDGSSTAVDLENIAVHDVRTVGIAVRGAVVTGRNLAIHSVRGRLGDNQFGRGLNVDAGGHATVEGLSIRDAYELGVAVFASNVVLRSASIVDTHLNMARSLGHGIIVGARGQLELEQSIVEQNEGLGVLLGEPGTRARLTDVVLRGWPSESPPDGASHRALGAEYEARVELVRVLVENTDEVAVYANGGSQLHASDLVVRNARATDRTTGVALTIQESSSGTVSRALITRSQGLGLLVRGPDAHLDVSDLSIWDTGTERSEGIGRGIEVSHGGVLGLRRGALINTVITGVMVSDQGSRATLEDLRVADVIPTSRFVVGRGLEARYGGQVQLRRAHIERTMELAILANGSSTQADVEDLVVSNNRAGAGTSGGAAVAAQAGATISLERALLTDNEGLGLASSESSTLVATDVEVLRTVTETMSGRLGVGAAALVSSRLSLERARLAENAMFGLYASSSTITARDLVVEDSTGDASGMFGRAAGAESGARIDIVRGFLNNNREASVTSMLPGSVVRLDSVAISRSRVRACAETTCTVGRAGIGVGAYLGGRIVGTNFSIRESALVGVQIGSDGDMELSSGEVSFNPIGANVQVPGFAIERISSNVLYLNNERNLDSSALVVPEASGF